MFQILQLGKAELLWRTYQSSKILIWGIFILIQHLGFIIRLDVDNPYTPNDTLELPNYNDAFNENNNRMYISGPFVNGVIDTVLNLPDMSTIRFNSASTFRVKHRFNNNPNWIDTELKISNHCTDQLYEAVIKIE